MRNVYGVFAAAEHQFCRAVVVAYCTSRFAVTIRSVNVCIGDRLLACFVEQLYGQCVARKTTCKQGDKAQYGDRFFHRLQRYDVTVLSVNHNKWGFEVAKTTTNGD